MLGFMLASFAGLSAALASLFMKLAFYEEHIIRDYLCTTWIEISANNCSKVRFNTKLFPDELALKWDMLFVLDDK